MKKEVIDILAGYYGLVNETFSTFLMGEDEAQRLIDSALASLAEADERVLTDKEKAVELFYTALVNYSAVFRSGKYKNITINNKPIIVAICELCKKLCQLSKGDKHEAALEIYDQYLGYALLANLTPYFNHELLPVSFLKKWPSRKTQLQFISEPNLPAEWSTTDLKDIGKRKPNIDQGLERELMLARINLVVRYAREKNNDSDLKAANHFLVMSQDEQENNTGFVTTLIQMLEIAYDKADLKHIIRVLTQNSERIAEKLEDLAVSVLQGVVNYEIKQGRNVVEAYFYGLLKVPYEDETKELKLDSTNSNPRQYELTSFAQLLDNSQNISMEMASTTAIKTPSPSPQATKVTILSPASTNTKDIQITPSFSTPQPPPPPPPEKNEVATKVETPFTTAKRIASPATTPMRSPQRELVEERAEELENKAQSILQQALSKRKKQVDSGTPISIKDITGKEVVIKSTPLNSKPLPATPRDMMADLRQKMTQRRGSLTGSKKPKSKFKISSVENVEEFEQNWDEQSSPTVTRNKRKEPSEVDTVVAENEVQASTPAAKEPKLSPPKSAPVKQTVSNSVQAKDMPFWNQESPNKETPRKESPQLRSKSVRDLTKRFGGGVSRGGETDSSSTPILGKRGRQ